MKTSVNNSFITQNVKPKPFVKWAGGKRQLLPILEKNLPENIINTKKIELYIEPFVGGGAFFFYLKGNYYIKKSILIDINEDLIITYKVIQNNVLDLITILKKMESEYNKKKTEEDKKKYYYKKRSVYNKQEKYLIGLERGYELILRAAYTIFLNRTCYNGLFRENNKGEFNVPFGKYKKPKICDEANLIAVNNALRNTKIIHGDFFESEAYVNSNTFIYLDPPYKPISKTSSFTKYTKNDFDDNDQIRLARFFKESDKKGAYLLLSNSYSKEKNSGKSFFEKLYKDFNIQKVLANRMINSNSKCRGKIFELLIKNY